MPQPKDKLDTSNPPQGDNKKEFFSPAAKAAFDQHQKEEREKDQLLKDIGNRTGPPKIHVSEDYDYKLDLAVSQVYLELVEAKRHYKENFTNQHEGYAVILEEIDELWQEIKKKQSQYDISKQRKEAKQAAAMLLRFMVELTPLK